MCFHGLKVTPPILRYKLTENASGNTFSPPIIRRMLKSVVSQNYFDVPSSRRSIEMNKQILGKVLQRGSLKCVRVVTLYSCAAVVVDCYGRGHIVLPLTCSKIPPAQLTAAITLISPYILKMCSVWCLLVCV